MTETRNRRTGTRRTLVTLSFAACAAALLVLVFDSREAADANARGGDLVCLPTLNPASKTCRVRPNRFHIDHRAAASSLRWRGWFADTRLVAIGFLDRGRGRPERARVQLSETRSCGRKIWYSRITVVYGSSFDRTYVRRLRRPNACT